MQYILIISSFLLCGLLGLFWSKVALNKNVSKAVDIANEIKTKQQKRTKIEVSELSRTEEHELLAHKNNMNQDLIDYDDDLKHKNELMDRREAVINNRTKILDNKSNHLNQKQSLIKQIEDKVSHNNKIADIAFKNRQRVLFDKAGISETKAKSKILDQEKIEIHDFYNRQIINHMNSIGSYDTDIGKSFVEYAVSQLDLKIHDHDNIKYVPMDDDKFWIKNMSDDNIKILEVLTGIDIELDFENKIVIINGYDFVRKSIMNRVLERITEQSVVDAETITNLVNKATKYVDKRIRRHGERTVKYLGIINMHPDMIKIIGRMYYRTSYGQNILDHSIESANLAGILADQMHIDRGLAVRASLLHDIGKAIDSDSENTHIQLGVMLAKTYGEDKIVINSIASHHGEEDPQSTIAYIVQAVDAISGARPGARNESDEDYLNRIKQLEEIVDKHQHIKDRYVIRSGKEIRIMVDPSKTDDEYIKQLSLDIKTDIEDSLSYPGQILITIIRRIEKVSTQEFKKRHKKNNKKIS